MPGVRSGSVRIVNLSSKCLILKALLSSNRQRGRGVFSPFKHIDCKFLLKCTNDLSRKQLFNFVFEVWHKNGKCGGF